MDQCVVGVGLFACLTACESMVCIFAEGCLYSSAILNEKRMFVAEYGSCSFSDIHTLIYVL